MLSFESRLLGFEVAIPTQSFPLTLWVRHSVRYIRVAGRGKIRPIELEVGKLSADRKFQGAVPCGGNQVLLSCCLISTVLSVLS